MVSKTHTMKLGRPKKMISVELWEHISLQKKLTFLAVIATKPLEIVFDKNTDNIKEVNLK